MTSWTYPSTLGTFCMNLTLILKTKILLQVHDELLFESPLDELEIIKKEVSKLMETSHKKHISLNVPIKVDIGVGKNWAEAH